MKLLLDTHIFLWYITADSRLSTLFQDAIRQPKKGFSRIYSKEQSFRL